jgi:hypothetical protein
VATDEDSVTGDQFTTIPLAIRPVGMMLRARVLVAAPPNPGWFDDGGFMGIPARLKKIRPGYRITSVLAGATVFAGAAFFATTGANADTQPMPKAFDGHRPAGAKAVGKVSGSDLRNKLPNVRKATTTEYKLGKAGRAFETPPRAQPRIVGGDNASVADHPYIVGIETLYWLNEGGPTFTPYVSTCTGTVISPTRVLTAGHCSFGSPHGTTYVIAGRNNLDTSGVGFITTVRSTFTHQGFAYIPTGGDPPPNNDVAVLTLTHPLPPEYTPITLGAQGDESYYADNTPAQIVGYGITAAGAEDHGILRAANVPIRSDSSCSSVLAGYQNGTMVCAGKPAAPGSPGVDTCAGDSGGPLIVTKNGVKTEVGITSWGPPACGSSFGAYSQVSTYSNLIKAEAARKSANNLDWSGDGHSDLITRDGAGNLLVYSGSGLVNSQFTTAFADDHPDHLGEGWGGFRKVFRTYNWNNDNKPSIFGITPDGNLFQFRGDGEGEFTTGNGELIGSGWTFADIMVTNNWINGVNRPNLMGRTSTGDLYLYTSNGAGGWDNAGVGIKIGSGWNMFNTVLTPGDWLGDGRQALIGRTPAGDLRLYQSDGNGGWVNGVGVQIGNGWGMFNIFMSPGDFNGDNLVDMVGATPAGKLRLYMTDGKGNWLNGLGQEIGTSGWNGFNAIF